MKAMMNHDEKHQNSHNKDIVWQSVSILNIWKTNKKKATKI